MRIKTILGFTFVSMAAVIVIGTFFQTDSLADVNSLPSSPDATTCGIVDGYLNFIHFVPQGPLSTIGSSAGETYYMYMSSPGLSSSSKMMIKYNSGSPETKEIQQYKNVGAALTPFDAGYADANLGSTLGPATMITKDNFGKCTYSFTIAQRSAELDLPNGPIPIPDNDPNGINPTINIGNLTGRITHVRVSLWINHTWDGDLIIQLIGPEGTTVTLSNEHGGSDDNYGTNSYTRTIFDDESTKTIASASPPFTDTFAPDAPLSNFVNREGNGTWTLHIVDSVFGDSGNLNAWSLMVTDQ